MADLMSAAGGDKSSEARPECVDDLIKLAESAKVAANHQHKLRRYYTWGRNVLWILAAALAGLAGVLALGGASRTLSAIAAFLSAFSAALEARFAPADKRLAHVRSEADYRDLGRRATWTANHEKDASVRCQDLKALLEDLHRLDRDGDQAQTDR